MVCWVWLVIAVDAEVPVKIMVGQLALLCEERSSQKMGFHQNVPMYTKTT
jgi:hypothetical protein